MDPRTRHVPPDVASVTSDKSQLTIRQLLVDYLSRHLEVNASSSASTAAGFIKIINREIGDVPVTRPALEDSDIIETFQRTLRTRTSPKEYSIASVNRIMATLRAALNWGRERRMHAVNPPKSVFNIRKSDETVRNRRLSDKEEQLLLTAALTKMDAPEHRHVGPRLHDCIVGALELPIRIGEMLAIQNRDVDWEHHQVLVKWSKTGGQAAKRRWVPFEPGGRLAQILARRKALGLEAFVFGNADGTEAKSIQAAWDALRLIALCGIEPTYGRKQKTKTPTGRPTWRKTQTTGWSVECQEAIAKTDLHWHDLRHEGACRLFRDGVDIRTIQLMLGHSTLSQTEKYLNVNDEELRQKMHVAWTARREKNEKNEKTKQDSQAAAGSEPGSLADEDDEAQPGSQPEAWDDIAPEVWDAIAAEEPSEKREVD